MNRYFRQLFAYFSSAKSKSDSEWEKWFEGQKQKLISGEEIEPPWIAFPKSSPIHGWNQGCQEAWKSSIWVIFWNKLNEAEKAHYLNRWNVPTANWRETIMVYWK